MSSGLPDRIEPLVLALAGRRFSGELALATLGRLGSLLASQDGAFRVDLEFGRDESGQPYLAGRIRGEVELLCQRCLEPMVHPVDAEVRLAMVQDDEEAARLPAHYEPLIVATESMELAPILEDEVLLSLPIVALHSEPHPCATEDRAPREKAVVKRENPFAVLARLKRDNQ
jgi:uncharacterized protein